MRRVVICSPWRARTSQGERLHARYLDACLADSYARGEAPIAAHAIGPRVLREEIEEERARGIQAGLAWIRSADALVVYVDLGISEGMVREAEEALAHGITIEERSLGGEWEGRR